MKKSNFTVGQIVHYTNGNPNMQVGQIVKIDDHQLVVCNDKESVQNWKLGSNSADCIAPEQVVQFTELEKGFLRALMYLLYAEAGFSDVDVADIAEWMEESKATVRGILGSLVKKGVVSTDAHHRYQLIYLHSDWYHLHPRWYNDSFHHGAPKFDIFDDASIR